MKKNELGRGMWNVWGRGEVHTGFWCGNLQERDHLKYTGISERIILKGYSRNKNNGRK
jgi:hypothetical protein